MTENIKIGITGPISEINFGDYAMLINNIYDLDVKDVTIFSYNKGFSELLLHDYFKNYNVNTIEVRLHENSEICSDESNRPKVGFQPFNHPTETPIDILYQAENLDEIESEIDKIDVLIVNGGGYFNHLWNNSLWRNSMLKKIMLPMIVASQKHKKIIFTGNGFGPFDQSEEYFNYIFNYLKNTTFAVRDRMYSKNYLLRLGIEKENIHFVPDDLYCINKELIQFPTNNLVDFSKIGKYIVLEVYFTIDEIKANILELKEFSERMHSKYGFSIIFIPFDFERGGMWQGEYLLTQLNNFYLCDIHKNGYLPIQDLHQIITNAELVLCTRYHALVLAVGAGVPVVNILKKVCDDHRYYFNKSYGLLEYAFDGLDFNEMDFLKIDFLEALNCLEESALEIIAKQKKLYKTNMYVNNKEKLQDIRHEYLKNNILGSE